MSDASREDATAVVVGALPVARYVRAVTQIPFPPSASGATDSPAGYQARGGMRGPAHPTDLGAESAVGRIEMATALVTSALRCFQADFARAAGPGAP